MDLKELRTARIGDKIEGWTYNEEEDIRVKHIVKVIQISEGGVYAMSESPFNKPHKDAIFFKNGDYKIYEP